MMGLSQGSTHYFVVQGLLSISEVEQAISAADHQKISLVRYLVKNNILSSSVILNSFAQTFSLPIYDLTNFHLNEIERSAMNIELINRYHVIPLKKEDDKLWLGIVDPSDQPLLNMIAFYSGMHINPVLIDAQQMELFVNDFCNQYVNKINQVHLTKKIELEEISHAVQENMALYDEPLILFVDNMLLHACEQLASDIHIEPYETYCRVRYRQQGLLLTTNELSNPLALRVITRLKVMAKLDIAEKRFPQDGRFQFNKMDVRLSTCPTLFGEKLVLRLLNTAQNLLKIDALGFSADQKNMFIKKISQPQGMILVTGPTGSGKTVTLYAALNYLNQVEKNILTVEDPIEIRLPGINQVNINSKIGLDFSTILRAFLRQDPDIIMLGEIRDQATANMALQAAQTGHLVLTTLHTNSAIESLRRLQTMEVDSYNVLNAISLIIAQRLIRKLCIKCKVPDEIDHRHLNFFSEQVIYRAEGCDQCLNGYSTRFAIYEFLPFDQHLIKLIVSNADILQISQAAKNIGFTSLAEEGLEKVRQGVTSLAEIHRVLQI